MTHIKEIHVNVILKRYQYYTIFICSLNMLSYIYVACGPVHLVSRQSNRPGSDNPAQMLDFQVSCTIRLCGVFPRC